MSVLQIKTDISLGHARFVRRAVDGILKSGKWKELSGLVRQHPQALLMRYGSADFGTPVFHQALFKIDIACVAELVALGAPLEARDKDGRTALLVAIQDGQKYPIERWQGVCQVLLDGGARIDALQGDGLGVIEASGGLMPPVIMTQLLKSACSLSLDGLAASKFIKACCSKSSKPLYAAQRLQNLRLFIDSGIDLNPCVQDISDLPLAHVLQMEHLSPAQYHDLADHMHIARGAQIDRSGRDGRTLMHIATSPEMIHWLHAKDDQLLHAVDQWGCTPLCRLLQVASNPGQHGAAAVAGARESAVRMIALGANLDHLDNQGVMARSPRQTIMAGHSPALLDAVRRRDTLNMARQALDEINATRGLTL